MNKQHIKVKSIDRSNILQIGGNYYKLSFPSSQISHKPIYFIYGDSDVQLLLYKVGSVITENKFYNALEHALKLLITFKPYTTCIVIAASSVIQSDITNKLVQKFKCFSECANPHIYFLRRESDWKDYLTKRREKSESLKKISRYSIYYDKKIIERLKGIPSLRRNFLAGNTCSQNWIEKAEIILNSFPSKVILNSEQLNEFSEEILFSSIFVWEAIEAKLNQIGIIIPKWSNDLQLSLVISYLSMYSDIFQLPTGINLSWDFWPKLTDSYYTNIKLLDLILELIDVKDDFLKIQPNNLLKMIISDELFEYKYKIEMSLNLNNMLYIAKKHKQLFIKALKSSQY